MSDLAGKRIFLFQDVGKKVGPMGAGTLIEGMFKGSDYLIWRVELPYEWGYDTAQMPIHVYDLVENNPIYRVPTADIHPDPIANVRYTPGDTTDLQASIKQHGIQDALWCRAVNGRYCVIEGSRRLAAAKALKLPHVPVQLKDVTDEQIRELSMIRDMQRDLPYVVVRGGAVVGGIALAIKEELERRNCSRMELAKSLGMTADTLGACLRLLDESPEVISAVGSGRMSIATYSRMKTQSDELKQKIVLGKSGKISANHVRGEIKKASKTDHMPIFDESEDTAASRINKAVDLISGIDEEVMIERTDLDILIVLENAVTDVKHFILERTRR